MKYIGAHFSIKNGFSSLVEKADLFGANSFALFTKPSLQWRGDIITEDVSEDFIDICRRKFFSKEAILPHASYLINMGNPDEKKSRNAQKAFIEEMKRCSVLGLSMLNFHPGSYLTGTLENSIKQIGKLVNEAVQQVPDVLPVYEMMSGQGTNIGFELEQIRDLVSAAEGRCGVCIDTCHVFGAGYDIRTEESWNEFMDKFEKTVGLQYLKGMHINDSKAELGSRKDRHENLGLGRIGLDAFRYIVKDRRTDNIPLIIETPDGSKWKEEIEFLKTSGKLI